VLDNITLKTLQRVRFKVSLSNQTSNTQLQKILVEVREMLEKDEMINEDLKVNFYEINSKGGLDILILFFVNSSDWNDYLIVKERVNFRILEIIRDNHSSIMTISI
jgi:MscS family membrane protein